MLEKYGYGSGDGDGRGADGEEGAKEGEKEGWMEAEERVRFWKYSDYLEFLELGVLTVVGSASGHKFVFFSFVFCIYLCFYFFIYFHFFSPSPSSKFMEALQGKYSHLRSLFFCLDYLPMKCQQKVFDLFAGLCLYHVCGCYGSWSLSLLWVWLGKVRWLKPFDRFYNWINFPLILFFFALSLFL